MMARPRKPGFFKKPGFSFSLNAIGLAAAAAEPKFSRHADMSGCSRSGCCREKGAPS
jgi:hypothetical protein